MVDTVVRSVGKNTLVGIGQGLAGVGANVGAAVDTGVVGLRRTLGMNPTFGAAGALGTNTLVGLGAAPALSPRRSLMGLNMAPMAAPAPVLSPRRSLMGLNMAAPAPVLSPRRSLMGAAALSPRRSRFADVGAGILPVAGSNFDAKSFRPRSPRSLGAGGAGLLGESLERAFAEPTGDDIKDNIGSLKNHLFWHMLFGQLRSRAPQGQYHSMQAVLRVVRERFGAEREKELHKIIKLCALETIQHKLTDAQRAVLLDELRKGILIAGRQFMANATDADRMTFEAEIASGDWHKVYDHYHRVVGSHPLLEHLYEIMPAVGIDQIHVEMMMTKTEHCVIKNFFTPLSLQDRNQAIMLATDLWRSVYPAARV
jgi:hypothetical protein